MLRLERHPDTAAFLEVAEAWLLRRPAEHNQILDLAAAPVSHSEGEAYAATLRRDSEVTGAALRTPPYPLLLIGDSPEAALRLAEDLAVWVEEGGEPPTGILAREALARSFAEAWVERSAGRAEDGLRCRLHVLEAVEPPTARPAGRMRWAEMADLDLLAEWIAAFVVEGGLVGHDPRALARTRIDAGSVALWEDEQGDAVATAAWSGKVAGGVRISMVYTPPDRRGRGYASAVVAGISEALLASGCRFCLLYTDLANPISNRIYARLGYRPRGDLQEIRFSPAAD